MNTRLIHIARHTARGGTVHRLKPTIFWFGAKGPWYCPSASLLALSRPCPVLPYHAVPYPVLPCPALFW